MDLQVDSATRIDLEGYYPLYSLAIAADGDGGVSVFTSASPHSQKSGTSPCVIEHLAVLPGDSRALPPLQAVERPIRAVAARTDPDGRLHLLWAEEEDYYPNAHSIRLYVSKWAATGWSGPERVSDPKARPGIHHRGEMDLILGPSTPEVCWIDWREEHFWISLVTACEGQFPKVYCSSETNGKWGAPTRIQKRGTFDVLAVSSVVDPGGASHLLWKQSRALRSKSGYSDVFHSMRIDGRWSLPTRITDNRNDDLTPGTVVRVAATRGRGDSILVAWISSRWLSQSQEDHVLEVRSYVAGQWSEGAIVLSRRARDVAWASGPGGTTGILFQEYPGDRDTYARSSGHSLYFIPIESLVAESKIVIASNTLLDVFDAAVAPDGSTHLVYVSVGADKATALQYRRGLR